MTRRILLVEDETIIALTAEDMLSELGYEDIVTAATLDQAMAAVGAGRFDAALLDVNLHGVLSTPVAERLAEQKVPFAFATGYGAAAPGTRFPGVRIITKPYTAATLARTIADLLED